MRWYSLACCFLYSPLAWAVQAHAQSPLVHDGYQLQVLPAAPALRRLPEDAAAATAACGVIPAAPASVPGKLEVVPLVKDRFFNKFFQGGGRLYRLVTQQQGEPLAVVVHSGVWTLSQVEAALKGQPDVLLRQGSGYLLRVPLLLESGATLVVREGESLRLSRERGAFIISMGTLHLRKARLEAWDEGTGKPAAMTDDDLRFSPFVVGWSGSRTFISESTVTGLGFAENLAQGLTLAVGPQGLAGYTLPPAARAMIHDSHFEGMYSAVHATAIPDLRLCRNQFDGSRLHAIHLDEGSSGLIFRNKVTATRGAYGLYFNKGVVNVRVLDNDISENLRSGISISESRDIVLARNEIRQNFDAIFLEDADHILLADNQILDNQRHGLSVRNVGRIRLQGDRIGPNRGVGIMARSEQEAGAARNAPTPPAAQHYSRFVEVALAAQAARGAKDATATPASSGVSALPSVTVRPPSPGVRQPGAQGPLNATGREDSGLSGFPVEAVGSGERAAREAAAAAPLAWSPADQKIEMLGVTLDGNHSSALVIARPYTVLMDRVSVMYPGVRRRPVFRGVLNYFESDILRRLTEQKTLLVAPGAVAAAGDSKAGGGKAVQ